MSELRRDGFSRWRGGDQAWRAIYNNRARLLSGAARQASKLRAGLGQRSFALMLDRGGMRKVWLRGRENLQTRYLTHVAGYKVGLIMRLLTGAGTLREFQAQAAAWFFCAFAARWPADRLLVRRRQQSVCRLGGKHQS